MAVVGVGVAVVGVAFDHDKRLLLSKTLSRETMPGPDVRLFVLAGEQAGTGRDIRPVFWGGQKHYMFCPRQAVFSVTRNRFRNRKQLARKGVGNSSEVVVFYRAPHVPRPDFNRRRVSGTLRSKMGTLEGIIASYGQKKRSRLSKAAPTNGGILCFDSRMKITPVF